MWALDPSVPLSCIVYKFMKSKYLIGIDLHGTLLDEQWEIKKDIIKELINSLWVVKDFCKIYICSGNDLTFIKKYIHREVRECFDGYILETGCVIGGEKEEKIIIPKKFIEIVKELEKKLKFANLKEVKYFARRLISISMFTKDETGGIDPSEIYSHIQDLVKILGYDDQVMVTHSSVAIDIVPKGYNKFTGMKYAAQGLKIIGIADSVNDYHMLLYAHCGFIPANHSPRLIDLLKNKKKKIVLINQSGLDNENIVLKSSYKYNKGVVDILNYINCNLRRI